MMVKIKSKAGLIAAGIYLLLVLVALVLTVLSIAGFYLVLITLPWSIVLLKWSASTINDIGSCLLAAFLNACLIYCLGAMTEKPESRTIILKYRAIPFIAVLALWIGTSFFKYSYEPSFFFVWMALAVTALLLTLIPIIYSIITQNRHDVSLVLLKLSRLPFLIIAAHILVQISGRTYTDEGGWWVLYLLLAICLPLSLLLYAIGLSIKKLKPK